MIGMVSPRKLRKAGQLTEFEGKEPTTPFSGTGTRIEFDRARPRRRLAGKCARTSRQERRRLAEREEAASEAWRAGAVGSRISRLQCASIRHRKAHTRTHAGKMSVGDVMQCRRSAAATAMQDTDSSQHHPGTHTRSHLPPHVYRSQICALCTVHHAHHRRRQSGTLVQTRDPRPCECVLQPAPLLLSTWTDLISQIHYCRRIEGMGAPSASAIHRRFFARCCGRSTPAAPPPLSRSAESFRLELASLELSFDSGDFRRSSPRRAAQYRANPHHLPG